MKNKLPDNLHNMATEENYSALMGSYIEDMASAEKPPTVEHEVLRAISFPTVTFDYRGRAMELPHLNFQGLNQDDKGKYVPVEWGYSTGHHSVSSPIRFKDRRSAMVEAVATKATALKNAEQSRQRSTLESELADINSELSGLAEMSANRTLLEGLLRQDIDASELAMKLKEKELAADEQALIEALIKKDEAQLQLLAPDLLQKQIDQLTRAKDRVESLLKSQGAAQTQDQAEVAAVQDVRTLFTKTQGILSETQVKNPVAGKPATELEITDGTADSATPGDFTLTAQGLHIPKPFPLAYIALGELVTLTSLQPEKIFGQETVGSQVREQNGIYRYINFSSRTGRHSGWGYMAALPKQ